MMQKWEERPFEIAYNLNPAYCTVLLHASIYGYQKKKKEGMPYPIIFLILPLIIYKPIRDRLPYKNTNQEISLWLKENLEILVDFDIKVRELVPYTKETLMFAMQENVINISKETGNLINIKKSLKIDWNEHSTPIDCKRKAKVLGKWFSTLSVETIYANFRIRP